MRSGFDELVQSHATHLAWGRGSCHKAIQFVLSGVLWTLKLAVMSAQIVGGEAGSWQCRQKAKESISGYYQMSFSVMASWVTLNTFL